MDNREFLKNQKKAYKFNMIDFLLIVIIIAAVSLLIYIMLGNSLLSGGEDVTLLYVIEISPIRNEFLASAHLITKGTKITDSVRRNAIGEIQDIKITDAYSNEIDMETGVVNKNPYPDHSKVLITVLAKCKKEKAKYVVNGQTVAVGVRLDFRTPYLVSYGNCTYIEEVNEDGSKKTNAENETVDEDLMLP